MCAPSPVFALWAAGDSSGGCCLPRERWLENVQPSRLDIDHVARLVAWEALKLLNFGTIAELVAPGVLKRNWTGG